MSEDLPDPSTQPSLPRVERITDAAQLLAELWSAPTVPHSRQDQVHAKVADWPELREALDQLAAAMSSGNDPQRG